MKRQQGSPKLTLERLARGVNDNFQGVGYDMKRLYTSIDNIYLRLLKVAYYPWPISAFLFWRLERAAIKAAIVAAEVQRQAQEAIEAENLPGPTGIVTADKSIVGPNGEAV